MKTIIRSLLTILFFSMVTPAFSQIEKLEESMEDENYQRVIKLADKYMDDREIRKNPLLYFINAEALYEMSQDEFWFEDNPDAIKDAVKSVKKGMKKDPDSAVYNMYYDFILDLVDRQNELALDQYKINKQSKAFKMFEDAYELDQNRYSFNMMAKCQLEMYDTVFAESKYKQLIEMYNQDLATGEEESFQDMDGHIYFINKYWSKKDYDSANYYLDNARLLFGGDPKINYYQKRIGMEKINSMPPSSLMMEYIKKNIALFPTDIDFLHKENALYIYLLKNHISAERYTEADTMLDHFASEKVARASSEDAYLIKEGDDFVNKKAENVYWKLAEYYQTFGHPLSAKYVLGKYIKMTAKDSTDEAIVDRWRVISDYAFQSKELPYAAFVLQESLSKTDDHPELLELRKTKINEVKGKTLKVDEQAALYSLMKDEYASNTNADNLETLQTIGDQYINLLVKNVKFSTAKEVAAELKVFDPKKDYSTQDKYLAQEDFYQNYFLSKTKGKDDEGNIVDLFEWDGSIARCEPGTVDQVVQQKVLDRINYFRRNAGVPEVLFDAATNEYCQKAALMMEANNRLDHEPGKNWRCYTSEGAYAAKHSLLVQKANTSIAVTSLMADQTNPTVGNRRWLLYPNGRIYGHGSTPNNAVIWALDDSGSTDTALYTEKAVCWPPQGYVPQMMLFKHWSFSLYQNLDSATIEVTQDGEPIDVEVMDYIEGYGQPTLVFIPKYNRETLPENSDFEVTITLSNGRNYSYTVRTFNYDPNKL